MGLHFIILYSVTGIHLFPNWKVSENPIFCLLQDYVVALPQVYYEAYQLEEKVTKPCQVNGINTLCNQFSYLSTKAPGFFTTELETGYIVTSRGVRPTQLFRDEKVLQQLDFSAMANLDNQQVRLLILHMFL